MNEGRGVPVFTRDRLSRVGFPLLFHQANLLLIVGLCATLLHPMLFRRGIYETNFRLSPDSAPTLATRYSTWDGQHYLFLAGNGYGAGQESNAFYPLWPGLIRAGSFLTGGSLLVSALLLANLLFLLGALLLHATVEERKGRRAANATVLLLATFPGGIFFLFPYSESVFLALAAAFFLLLQRGRLGLAAIPAFLLPLSRPVGIFVGLPLAWEIYRRWRKGEEPRRLSTLARSALPLASPLLGFATYLGIFWLSTGNPFEGMSSQGHFVADRSVGNVLDVGLLVRNFFEGGAWHGILDSWMDRGFFLLLLVLLIPIFRLDVGWFLFCLGIGVFPVMTGTFWSMTRFFSLVFPAFVVLGIFLASRRGRLLRWPVLSLFVVFQVVFLLRHTNNFWVG